MPIDGIKCVAIVTHQAEHSRVRYPQIIIYINKIDTTKGFHERTPEGLTRDNYQRFSFVKDSQYVRRGTLKGIPSGTPKGLPTRIAEEIPSRTLQ